MAIIYIWNIGIAIISYDFNIFWYAQQDSQTTMHVAIASGENPFSNIKIVDVPVYGCGDQSARNP